ncbi:MAG: IS66 family transposase [Myxococcota bacterium]|nr:IS66 family transposase [Myxococcota bacterium]
MLHADVLAKHLEAHPELREAVERERAEFAARIAELEKERDRLRASHERLRQELELFKRRLFIAKAERVDTRQLELEYMQKLRELDLLAGTLGMASGGSDDEADDGKPAKDGKRRGNRKGNRGTGRRDLRSLPLPEERIEIPDPHLEALVAEGKVVRHGFEETCKIAHQRGGKRRLVIARVRYKTVDAAGNTDVITTAMPEEMLPSAIATPSLVAHVVMENIGKGMPLFRIEDSCSRDGIPIDRGTLSRWKKTAGDRLGETVVAAMRQHALATAFCVATDATGVCVQPIPNDRTRQPCKKGHFLVQIADRDHILFDYLERETSTAIYGRFRGFSGYVQADAKSVFDVLFSDEQKLAESKHDVEHDGAERVEVGCWYHARRRFWEGAVAKNTVAREGLARIGRIFELDASWQKKPPREIKKLRETHLRPHVSAFFAWVDQNRPTFKEQRGLVRTALEYAHNHREALQRFFDDGRLVLSNNWAERAIKPVATGRKAWLFCGSDDHAKSTATWFSLVGSARLHRLDPEEYLRCLIRLVPVWPEHRMLELTPLFWARTRERLDPSALAAELGPISIPDAPLDTG